MSKVKKVVKSDPDNTNQAERLTFSMKVIARRKKMKSNGRKKMAKKKAAKKK